MAGPCSSIYGWTAGYKSQQWGRELFLSAEAGPLKHIELYVRVVVYVIMSQLGLVTR